MTTPVRTSQTLLLTASCLIGLLLAPPAGAQESYQYDQAGRLTEVGYPDGRVIRYHYGPNGALSQRVVTHGEPPVPDQGPTDGVPDSTGNNPPGQPHLIAPANAATGVDPARVTFEFERVSDPDGDAVTYRLLWCADPAFAGCTPQTVAAVVAPSPPGRPPAAPVVLLVGAALVGMLCLAGLRRWRRRLLVAAVGLALAALTTSCSESSGPPAGHLTYEVEGLDAATTYYWKVEADDGHPGGLTPSETWHFTTK